MISASQILNAKKAGDIYSNDFDKAKAEYKELVKKYHPDVYNAHDAKEIFQKITLLYNEALKNIENNTWEKSNCVIINKANGKKIQVTFLEKSNFELGICYICNNHILYVLDENKKKYKDNMINILSFIRYRDENMRKEFERYLPKIVDTYETIDGKHCIVLEKTTDVYPLKNIYEYYDKKIEPRHVAWIISRLSNISCFLKYNNIVHNGISIENCFISPEHHSILLLGGWWYATKINEKMIGTIKEIYDVMPLSSKSNKISSPITDLESIKLIGRKLIGEESISKLVLNTTIPKPIIEFLIKGSGDDAYKEFVQWDKALDDGYGKRKFIEMNVTKKQIYNL